MNDEFAEPDFDFDAHDWKPNHPLNNIIESLYWREGSDADMDVRDAVLILTGSVPGTDIPAMTIHTTEGMSRLGRIGLVNAALETLHESALRAAFPKPETGDSE